MSIQFERATMIVNHADWHWYDKPQLLFQLDLRPGMVLWVQDRGGGNPRALFVGHMNDEGGTCNCCGHEYDIEVLGLTYLPLPVPDETTI